jgi:hypothetical protein
MTPEESAGPGDGAGESLLSAPAPGGDSAHTSHQADTDAKGTGSVFTALVARASEIPRDRGAGACHIGWTVRESFYTRAGYRPRRRYRMFRRATSCPQTPPSTRPE